MLSLPALRTVLPMLLVCFCLPAVAQQVKPEKTVSVEKGLAKGVEKEKEAEPGCRSFAVKAVTDRPTVASGTETTQCGVLEILSGPEQIWAGRGVHQDDVSESVQFGLTPRLDLHYARSGFFGLGKNAGPFSGEGDTFVGARFRFSKERRFVPSFGTFYTLKVPTATVENGMGTGRYDHALSLLVSKDLPKVHVDFNLTPQLAGRPDGPGYDKNTQMVLFGSVPVFHTLTLIAGSFGSTTLNEATPGFASGTVGFAWQVLPRFILDVGYDEGLTSFAPRKRIGVGFTFAPVNLYALVAGRPKVQ